MSFLKSTDSVVTCDCCQRIFTTVDEPRELPDAIYCKCGTELKLFPVDIELEEAMQNTQDIIKDIEFEFNPTEHFINDLYSQLRSALSNECYFAAHFLKQRIRHYEKLRASK